MSSGFASVPKVSLLGRHPSPANQCVISANGKFGITTSADHAARVWDLENDSYVQLDGHDDIVVGCDITSDGTVAFTTSQDGSMRAWNAMSGEQLCSMRSKAPEFCFAHGCATVSQNRSNVVVTFGSDSLSRAGSGARQGEVVLAGWPHSSRLRSWPVEDGIPLECAVSSDGSVVAYTVYNPPLLSQVRLQNVAGPTSCRQWNCSPKLSRPAIAMTQTGDVLCIVEANNIRICDTSGILREKVQWPFEKLLAGGFLPYCSMVPTGDALVLTSSTRRHAVIDINAKTKLYNVRRLAQTPALAQGCAISADRSKVLTCCSDGTVALHRLPLVPGHSSHIAMEGPTSIELDASRRGGRVLTDALRAVLNPHLNARLLTHRFLNEVMNEDNIHCVRDLYFGHNLLLMAIRSGVLTPKDIEDDQLEENSRSSRLYCAIRGRLRNKASRLLASRVLLHARSIGLGEDYHAWVMDPERLEELSKKESKSDLSQMFDLVQSCARMLCSVNVDPKRVGQLPTTHALTTEGHDYRCSGLTLEQSLRNLKKIVTTPCSRRVLYAGIAQVNLCLIPVLRGAIALVEGPHQCNIDRHDPEGVSSQRFKVAAAVDLTNLHVLRVLTSPQFLARSRLEQKARTTVQEAVEMAFGSHEEMCQLLGKRNEANDQAALRLDHSGSEWMSISEPGPSEVASAGHNAAAGVQAELDDGPEKNNVPMRLSSDNSTKQKQACASVSGETDGGHRPQEGVSQSASLLEPDREGRALKEKLKTPTASTAIVQDRSVVVTQDQLPVGSSTRENTARGSQSQNVLVPTASSGRGDVGLRRPLRPPSPNDSESSDNSLTQETSPRDMAPNLGNGRAARKPTENQDTARARFGKVADGKQTVTIGTGVNSLKELVTSITGVILSEEEVDFIVLPELHGALRIDEHTYVACYNALTRIAQRRLRLRSTAMTWDSVFETLADTPSASVKARYAAYAIAHAAAGASTEALHARRPGLHTDILDQVVDDVHQLFAGRGVRQTGAVDKDLFLQVASEAAALQSIRTLNRVIDGIDDLP